MISTKFKNNRSNIILVYDSECIFCCKFVEFLDSIYEKSKYQLLIASSISNALKSSLISETMLDNKAIYRLESLSKESMIFFDNNQRVFFFSDAFKEVIKYSNNKILNFFIMPINLLPKSFLNFIYKNISSNRLLISKIFGIRKYCKKSFKYLIVV